MSDLLWVVKSALLCGYMDLPHFSGVYDSIVLGCKYLELESRTRIKGGWYLLSCNCHVPREQHQWNFHVNACVAFFRG